MEIKHLILGLLEGVVWYFFIYYLIDTIRKPTRNLWVASGVLLALFCLGFVLCPWVRHTPAWESLQ
ncbi:hypothetical protein LF1_07500 [Rubripirellula obstinata]|uniref:Uncharacterized protein n=1 Tax=Rubripirellula obstinata TaxID=406547 RepID=A0A5B1CG55_9BACT|nr:hypothetical protein [Rubripirellula obstinata]KAA1258234.1 hypothetical protein LF1_07500 [Rubripirellula obstinata]